MIVTEAEAPAYRPDGVPVTSMTTGNVATPELVSAVRPIEATVPLTGPLAPLGGDHYLVADLDVVDHAGTDAGVDHVVGADHGDRRRRSCPSRCRLSRSPPVRPPPPPDPPSAPDPLSAPPPLPAPPPPLPDPPLTCSPTVSPTVATIPSIGAVSVAPLRAVSALSTWDWSALTVAWSAAICALDAAAASSWESRDSSSASVALAWATWAWSDAGLHRGQVLPLCHPLPDRGVDRGDLTGSAEAERVGRRRLDGA